MSNNKTFYEIERDKMRNYANNANAMKDRTPQEVFQYCSEMLSSAIDMENAKQKFRDGKREKEHGKRLTKACRLLARLFYYAAYESSEDYSFDEKHRWIESNLGDFTSVVTKLKEILDA